MEEESNGVEWIDIGRPVGAAAASAPPTARPGWRIAAVGAAVFLALVGAYGLGRSGGPAPELIAAPREPTATAVPAATPIPTATPLPTPTPPPLTDLLGQGLVLDELARGDGTRAVIWCRESVPGTRIPPTLALLHVAPTARFGDQLVSHQELTTPWVPSGTSWRGTVDTEGFGIDASAVATDDQELESASTDGASCESCAPERSTVAGAGTVLYGDCEHGVPFRASIAYIVATPSAPGETPLAIHASCGITSIRQRGEQFLIESEVPLVRGLTDARFKLPTATITYDAGRFWADDLRLLDWACDIERSSQLGDRHLLRTDVEPTINYEVVESSLGPIGMHGPLIVGLDREQCSRLTRAWWGPQAEARGRGRPIADLVGLEPPEGERDWFYTCQPTQSS